MPDLKPVAKTLIYDIENSPNLGWTWGKYEQNVIKFEKERHLLCFAYKWLGESKTQVVALPDFEGYEIDKEDDFELCRKLHDLFTQADILVAHNGNQFDQKVVNSRLWIHNFDPPEPYKQIDTLREAKKYFSLNSYKLDDLGETLGIGRKVKHPGFEMWIGCMNGDPKYWKLMKKYNKGDVDLLERLYIRLRPWMNNHPAINLIDDSALACPKCGGDHLQSRGLFYTKTGAYRRFQCMSCYGWSHGRTAEPREDKMVLVN